MEATHAQNNYCETLSQAIHLLWTAWAPENSTQCVGDHALGTMNLTYLRTRNLHKYKLCTLKFKYSLPEATYNCSNAFFGIQRYLIGLGYSFTENTHPLQNNTKRWSCYIDPQWLHFPHTSLKSIFLAVLLLDAHPFLLHKLFYENLQNSYKLDLTTELYWVDSKNVQTSDESMFNFRK